MTNRQAHEEAAGMGLDDMFFRMNGIDPDAEAPEYIPPKKDSGYKELFITEEINPDKLEFLKSAIQKFKDLAKESGYTPEICDYYFSEKHAAYLKRNLYDIHSMEIDGVTYHYTEIIKHGDTPVSSEVFDDVKLVYTK